METPATEEVKTAIENSVSWYLADKLRDATVSIAVKKYLTSNNLLVYLTRCNVAETSIPRVKVQILQRVDGGIHESSYQLYGDHRLEKAQNDMIFGIEKASDGSKSETVTESEAHQLLELVNSLQNARQTL
jgi:hypothetical protein